MKNLIIYFSQTGSFDNPRMGWTNDEGTLIKIQIDNSLDLGWKLEDILLFTNFEYQYRGVKAIVFNNSEFSQKELKLMKCVPESSKFIFTTKLFEKGIINSKKEDQIYWLHDLDSFQLEPITDLELELDKYDAGAVNYCNIRISEMVNYHTGTIFFRSGARDIFSKSVKILFEKNTNSMCYFNDENAFNLLCNTDRNMRKRIKDLDWRYTIKRYGFEHCLNAIKPIKIAHLRPDNIRGTIRSFDKFTGENDFHVSILPERIIRMFARYGIIPKQKNIKTQMPLGSVFAMNLMETKIIYEAKPKL